MTKKCSYKSWSLASLPSPDHHRLLDRTRRTMCLVCSPQLPFSSSFTILANLMRRAWREGMDNRRGRDCLNLLPYSSISLSLSVYVCRDVVRVFHKVKSRLCLIKVCSKPAFTRRSTFSGLAAERKRYGTGPERPLWFLQEYRPHNDGEDERVNEQIAKQRS